MARKKNPTFRLHRSTGQAVVTLTDATSGRRKDIYLGEHGTPEAHAEYARVIADWISRGRTIDAESPSRRRKRDSGPDRGTVAELCIAFIYDQTDRGVSEKHMRCIKAAIRILRSVHGGTPVNEFGPLALQDVRRAMIEKRYGKGRRWTRSTVNRRVRHLIRMFRWAVAEERAPIALPEALACVAPLKAGEFGVPEGKKVKPVPENHVDDIRDHVSGVVWAMIQVQRYTAARAGEVCAMRPIDLDTNGKVWIYRVPQHKNSHRGHERVVYLGKRAQKAIKPLLAGRAVEDYLFSPRESMADRRATNASKGKSRRDDQAPTPTRTKRKVGDQFTTDSYRRAIVRACETAGVPTWSTHQLRHLAATKARKEFGAEAALLLLGDKSTRLVDLYAEKNAEAAKAVVAKIG